MRYCRFVALVMLSIPSGGCIPSDVAQPEVPPEQRLFGSAEVIQVRATGFEYEWGFIVPGVDSLTGTADDVSLKSVLWLPPNRKIRLHFASRDYVYTFLQSDLNINEIAVPGVLTEASFLSPAEGEFDISASPLCGFMFAHAGYRPYIKVGIPEELPIHDDVILFQSQQP